MSAIVTITWDFVPGSLSTLVEYKLSSSSIWIMPTSPNNPTTQNTYTLIIDDNTYYDVRLTTNGISCGPKSTTFQIFKSGNGCCPVGYTLSMDGTYCYQTNTTAATPPSGAENAQSITNVFYDVYGTVIIDPGYSVDGVPTGFTQIPYSNPFWVNGPGYPSTGLGNTSDGPQNRSGVWGTTFTAPQDVGFSICITVPSTATYYLGIGCDDYAIIRIDGNTILQQDLTAICNYFKANGYPSIDSCPSMGFRFWYIYPVTLTAGNHTVELVGHNSVGTTFGSASIGCEIYNLTPLQIQSATSYGDMGAGLIFSSKDYVGQPIQIGTGGVGYTCPDGYSLVLCDGPAYCTQTLTTETIPCTTTTTTTTTSSTTTTTTTP